MAVPCDQPGCSRQGCSQHADVAFGFEAEPYVIWLDHIDRAEAVRGRAGVLCLRHADSMKAPIGWTLDDRRIEVPQLFAAAENQASTPPPPQSTTSKRRKRSKTEAPDVPAELFPPVEAAVSHSTDPWLPVFDAADDLDGLLDAKSPLLSRAFRASGGREMSTPR